MLKVALVLLCLTCVRCDVAKVCGQMKAWEGKVQKLHQGTAKADITITAATSVVEGKLDRKWNDALLDGVFEPPPIGSEMLRACSFDVSCARLSRDKDGKPVIKTQQVKMKVAQEIDVYGSLFTGNVISIKDSIVVGKKKSNKLCFHGAIDEEKNISELHWLTAAGECNAMNGLCRVLAWQAVATAAGTTESYLLDHANKGCQLPSGDEFKMNLKFYQLKAKGRTYYEGFGYESVGDQGKSFPTAYKGNKFPMSKYRRGGEVEITDASVTTQVGLLIVGEKGPPDFTVAKMLTQDQIWKLPKDSPVELKQDGKWVQTTVINAKYRRGSDQIRFGIKVDKKKWVPIATLVESMRLREGGEVPCAGVAECARGKTVAQCTAAIWPAKLKLPANCNCGRALENWMRTNPTWKQVSENDVYRLTLPKKEAPVLVFLEAGSKSSHGLLRRN